VPTENLTKFQQDTRKGRPVESYNILSCSNFVVHSQLLKPNSVEFTKGLFRTGSVGSIFFVFSSLSSYWLTGFPHFHENSSEKKQMAACQMIRANA
jgi:ssDNA-specific exonuclease RecJ